MVRVLHVTDHLQVGGAERMLGGLVTELGRGGLTENVVCTATADGADPHLAATVRRHATRAFALGHRSLVDPRLTGSFVRVLRRERIDVVHSHPGVAHLHARLAARMTGCAHLTTLHTMQGPAIEDSRRLVAADLGTARLSQGVVAPTPEVADSYRRAAHLPAERMRVIANVPQAAVPGPAFDRDAVRAELTGGAAARVVVCVARLQPAKGIADLVAAVPELLERVGAVRVVVAGSGPEEERLRALAADLGVEREVVLLGHRDDVGDLLAAADAFCLPSHHEGQPLSLLEAMRAGLPCVATAVGGVASLLQDGRNGLLCAPHAPHALALALAAVLGDEDLAAGLGRRALARAADHAPADAARSYAELYRALVRGAPLA